MTAPLPTPITPRGAELSPDAALPFEAIGAARALLRSARHGALATLDPSGYPHNTMTNVAIEPDGTPVFFTAGLAVHARNLEADPRCALSLAASGPDMMTAHRLTLVGRAEPAEDADALKALYARRFPKAKLYLGLPDARMLRLRVEGLQINGGPGRNASAVTPADLRCELRDAEALMAAAPALLDGLDAARAAAAAGAAPGAWRVVSLDPEGLDLGTESASARLAFPERVTSPEALVATLAALGV